MLESKLLSPTTRINLIILGLGFLLFCVLQLIDYLTSIVGMIAGALLLTYLLLGPVRYLQSWLERWRVPFKLQRTLAIILVYLLFFGVVALAVVRVMPTLSLQIKEFAHDVPNYLSKVQDTTEQPTSASPSGVSALIKAHPHEPAAASQVAPARQSKILSATTDLATEKLAQIYQQYASKLGGLLLDIGTTTLTGLVYALTTLVLVFILLHDGNGLKRGFVNLMPIQNEAQVAEFLERLNLQFYSFTKGQTLMSLIAGGLMYLLLMLLNIKYALLLGIFFGVVSILPVIGPWVGLIPITLLLAFGDHPLYILQVLLFSGIFYIIKTYWLWPKLIDRRFDIHPIIFILTFLACLKLVGYLGILLSFPLASLLGVSFDMMKARQESETSQTQLPFATE